MQANFQLLTGDSAIGGDLQLPFTQSWTADNIVSIIDFQILLKEFGTDCLGLVIVVVIIVILLLFWSFLFLLVE